MFFAQWMPSCGFNTFCGKHRQSLIVVYWILSNSYFDQSRPFCSTQFFTFSSSILKIVSFFLLVIKYIHQHRNLYFKQKNILWCCCIGNHPQEHYTSYEITNLFKSFYIVVTSFFFSIWWLQNFGKIFNFCAFSL